MLEIIVQIAGRTVRAAFSEFLRKRLSGLLGWLWARGSARLMAIRTAHGRARELGRLTVSECPPMDELRPASGADPGRPGRDAGGRFLPGNGWARLAKVRSGPKGVLATLEAKAAPEWRAARRWGRRAAQHRIREYQAAHGANLSSGVCGLLVESAELRADASYLRARAAHDDNPDLLRTAAQLSARAGQAERDAWALATLEAQAHPKASPRDALTARILAGKEGSIG